MKKKALEVLPVFVYGTLRHGQHNYKRYLFDRTAAELPAIILGELYEVRGGGFPCMVDGRNLVFGELMAIQPERYEATVRDLDRLEGYSEDEPERSMYHRRRSEVRLEDGSIVEAWAYYWNPRYASDMIGPRIKGGDWNEHIQNSRKRLLLQN